MEYQLALSPNLEVRSADFVEEWNASPEYRAKAEAHLDPSKATQYDPSLIDGSIVVLAVTLAEGVATNALYDGIKFIVSKLKPHKQGGHKHTKITQIDTKDGTHILVVTIDEE
jgi:hypothetical protein